MMPNPVLEVRSLALSFGGNQAVDGASWAVEPGQTLAIVGESGCGKSVSAMSVLQLLPTPPAKYDHGEILYRPSAEAEPQDLLQASPSQIRGVRGGEIAMIFQEPMTSLNPVTTIGEQLVEAIRQHRKMTKTEARATAIEALDAVGIPKPGERLKAYPHEFSGGMRQRVMIAMALACEPRVLLADEPTTALDVTIQAQILDLISSLRASRGLGVVLITHDLGVVAQHADVVCVMYAGRVVETAAVKTLFEDPKHPYTRGLLACIPKLRERQERLDTIAESVREPSNFAITTTDGHQVHAWWPWHEPPAGVTDAVGPASDSVLAEVASSHWVALWGDASARSLSIRPPHVSLEPVASAGDHA